MASQVSVQSVTIYNLAPSSYEAEMCRGALYCLLFLVTSACAGRQATQRGDGSYVLDCSDQKACLERAKRTCGEEGYIVLGGRSNKKRYGTPGHEMYIGKDEMYFRCNRDRPVDAPDARQGEWSLRRPDGSKSGPSASSKASSPAPAEKVCRPGETQRCVGPAACTGGQACLADGSGFGPCDCGTTVPSVESAPKNGTGSAGDSGHSP